VTTSVDDKGQLWWAGSWIWGVLTLGGVLSLTGVVDLFDPRIYAALLLFGILLSMPFGMSWAKGEVVPRPPKPITMRFREDVLNTPGMYAMEFIDVPKQKMGPRITERALGPVLYDLWWLIHRFPLLIGDKLLSGVWTLIARLTGSPAEPERVPASGEAQPSAPPPPIGPGPSGADAAAGPRAQTMEERYGGDFVYRGPDPPTMVGDVPLSQVKKPTDNAF
jgi:hypothetical protein